MRVARLLADRTVDARLGSDYGFGAGARDWTLMGRVMIGFSVGTSISAPVGGVPYQRLGSKVPFIFSLVLRTLRWLAPSAPRSKLN